VLTFNLVLMKFTVAQLNYHIGNFTGNKDLICKAIKKAKAAGSDLIIFSELCIPGYPPLDLLDRLDFIEKCGIKWVGLPVRFNGLCVFSPGF